MPTNRFATYPSLNGRVVLITGGGSGIGASIVAHFSNQQARVAFLDIADEPSQQLCASLPDNPPLYIHCDLTDINALRAAITRIATELGPIEVLVNNAANDDRHNHAEITPEYWDRCMNVNLRHQFFAMQAVAPHMASAGGGSIINMSSISWMIPSTGMPAYVTAKSAIIGLTRTMSKELAGQGIRVNAILPGAIFTERQQRLWFTPELTEQILNSQAIKRPLVPEDVARLVLFLSADDSSAITNQSYVVDGGWV